MSFANQLIVLVFAMMIAVTVSSSGFADDEKEPTEGVFVKVEGKWQAAELPLKELEKGKAVEVQVRGKLIDGIFAIGGETTGTIIKFGKTAWELDLGREKEQRELAEKLNGRQVVATGTVRQKSGVEIRKRTIVTVKSLVAAEKPDDK